ncbi:formylglycine-generating enzyme family protein [bacterium]|nr:formylglycine-generating enzyme family protein [bacterium]
MVTKNLFISILLLSISQSLFADDFINFLGIRFKDISAGSFYMGSCKPLGGITEKKTGLFGLITESVCPSGGKADMAAEEDEQPQHLVNISRPFQIGIHEVTYGQYKQYLNDNNLIASVNFTKHNSHGDDSALVWVSWFQARSFIDWLNLKKPASDNGKYRLPTEAEWEYVARAGTTDPYFFGDQSFQIGRFAWIIKDLHGFGQIWSKPVGQKQPNPWGLYDIYGNVWEWVQDVYGENYYKNSPTDDPKGPVTGGTQVARGCSLYTSAVNCRSAKRFSLAADQRNGTIGFRLVRELP